ncbi:MAG: hypothetical protein MAG795_00560 [Candidatus Woesearchaeota archaeon]|nr:hypothetical protein [Candidatus Woesearchaeota archaeon]
MAENKPIGRRAQSSVEFALIISFMFIVLTIFFSAASERLSEIQAQNDKILLEDFGSYLKNEIQLGAVAVNGYERQFEVPEKLAGREYIIKINPYSGTDINHSEVVLKYVNHSVIYEYTIPVSINVTGQINQKESPIVNISKKNSIVFINS